MKKFTYKKPFAQMVELSAADVILASRIEMEEIPLVPKMGPQDGE